MGSCYNEIDQSKNHTVIYLPEVLKTGPLKFCFESAV